MSNDVVERCQEECSVCDGQGTNTSSDGRYWWPCTCECHRRPLPAPPPVTLSREEAARVAWWLQKCAIMLGHNTDLIAAIKSLEEKLG